MCASCFSHVQHCATPWTAACQAPLSMGFSRQEYWGRVPCPPPGDLPNPGIKPKSLMSPALAGRFFTTSTTWKANKEVYLLVKNEQKKKKKHKIVFGILENLENISGIAG